MTGRSPAVVFIHTGGLFVWEQQFKKTISLPPDLAKEAEEVAEAEGKTLSGIIQEALRLAHAERFKDEFRKMQEYWSHRAKEKGILTEKDLERYLKR